MTCTITELCIYPIKACRAVSLSAAEVSGTGLAGDRQLLVVADGAMLNQKRAAALATIVPSLAADGSLTLQAPGAGSIEHHIQRSGDQLQVNYYMDQLQLVDQGDTLAGWFSDVLQRDVRLVVLPAPYARNIPLQEFASISGQPQSGFPDVAPLLLTNTASLADLNTRLDSAVPMDRFRPNVVVEGLDAYAEDTFTTLRGSAGELRRVTRCERCAVTATDQTTGARGSEPLAMLKSYRKQGDGFAGGIVFGAYATFVSVGVGVGNGSDGPAVLRVGDRLAVS